MKYLLTGAIVLMLATIAVDFHTMDQIKATRAMLEANRAMLEANKVILEQASADLDQARACEDGCYAGAWTPEDCASLRDEDELDKCMAAAARWNAAR